jgi:hypothetical protein
MGGTLTIRRDHRHGHEYCFGVESSVGLMAPGTLLGPEGTAVWLVPRTPTPVNFACLSGGGDGWLVVA